MNSVKLMMHNIRYILADADLTALRFVLSMSAFGSALWFAVMVWYGMSIADIEATRKLAFEVFPFRVWTILVTIYGIVTFLLVALKIEHQTKGARSINIIASMTGALLWSLNASLLVATRIEEGHLSFSLMVAQWMLLIVAWWVFIRDCYGR